MNRAYKLVNFQVLKVAEQILTNQDEDSEVRIQAFLLLIDSPSAQTAETVKNVIDSERSDQGTNQLKFLNELKSGYFCHKFSYELI